MTYSGVVIDLNPLPLNPGYLCTVPSRGQRSILDDYVFTNLHWCVSVGVNLRADHSSLGMVGSTSAILGFLSSSIPMSLL